MKILVSACLLGENCKYSGGNNYNQAVCDFARGHQVVPVCPEVLGGLPTPRCPAEIVQGVVTNKEGIEKEDSAFSYPHTGRSAVIFSNSCARNVSLSLRWLLCGASPFSRYPSHLYTVPNQKNRIMFSSKNRE